MKKINNFFDVIIIGGGPAGSTAGYLLKKFGLKVLIIDKSIFPRLKLCGGIITQKTVSLLERVFFKKEIFLKNEGIFNYSSNNLEIYYKTKLLSDYKLNFPFYFVDRKEYDNFLLEEAIHIGVEVLLGETIKEINFDKKELILSNGWTIRANYIIGADGVTSIVRRKFFKNALNGLKWKNELATGLEIFINRSKIDIDVHNPKVFLGYVNCGFSWIFPNKDKILIGMGGLNSRNNNINKCFINFLDTIKISKTCINKIYRYPVSFGNFMFKPINGSIILVGESAGFVDPLTGEGIFYAQRSAELAAISIYKDILKEAELESGYLSLLKQYIYPELIFAKKIRIFPFRFLNDLSYNTAKILLKKSNKKFIEVVHGKRSYKYFKKRKNY